MFTSIIKRIIGTKIAEYNKIDPKTFIDAE